MPGLAAKIAPFSNGPPVDTTPKTLPALLYGGTAGCQLPGLNLSLSAAGLPPATLFAADDPEASSNRQ
jgi:hypothetical protein